MITEIPYQVNKLTLVKSIIDLVDEKRIEGIHDVVDHSSREGMRVVIDLKRDANPQVVLNQLFAFTQMQVTFGVIMLALVDGVPRVLSLKQMLEEYIRFQVEVITRRTLYDLRKAKERAHIVEALKVACDFIDEVIEIIRSSPDIPESKARLMARFGFDDVQAQAIVQMRLGQLPVWNGRRSRKNSKRCVHALRRWKPFSRMKARSGNREGRMPEDAG